MLPKIPTTRIRDSQRAIVTTTCFIANLHCPSCAETIHSSLSALHPAPESTTVSVVAHSVVVCHSPFLSVAEISGSLNSMGFEVQSIFQGDKVVFESPKNREVDDRLWTWFPRLERAGSRWPTRKLAKQREEDKSKNTIHAAQCEQCRNEQGGVRMDSVPESTPHSKGKEVLITSPSNSLNNTLSVYPNPTNRQSSLTVERIGSPMAYKATLALSGMTCSSCVNSITHAVEQLPYVQTTSINLLTSSGVVVFHGEENLEEITDTIEDCGFDVSVEILEELNTSTLSHCTPKKQHLNTWQAIYTIGGMTCGSCVGHITGALDAHTWIDAVDINLISGNALITFQGKDHLSIIKESIEDTGYTAALESLILVNSAVDAGLDRTTSIRIDGMFCHHCPDNIVQSIRAIAKEEHKIEIVGTQLSLESPVLHLEYVPDVPLFSIRHILDAIAKINPEFRPSIYHPPTIEERAGSMHAAERKRMLRHLTICILVALPTSILGIVFMSLVPANDHVRQHMMETMWVGNVTRLNWALFFLAIPAYVYSAKSFHVRAFVELRAMWRPGSHVPILHRFTRFGSMNMLMSLGTTIAFFASLAELVLAATKKSSGSMENSYFDAVVFLTLFLLIGRFLEASSKARTGDAITSLGKLRPIEAVLVAPDVQDVKIATDLLEIGDTVRVHHGASPPFDGIILDGNTNFDESSLTGESRLVKKAIGDYIYSGTVNKGAPIKMKITTISGTSMVDQIIDAVREGQTHRAPVERVADMITAHFVPFVIFVAIVTWLIWLLLGTTDAIPKDWRDDEAGGWALWSLRFAIAVFVIACPCGIGLAAPTALFVGGGLAATHGILVRGGGEAFQEASSLDCIVFDKTGTLTQGGDPAVTEFADLQGFPSILGIVKAMENNSGHPIAQALASFCMKEAVDTLSIATVSETPGKGLKGTLDVNGQSVTVIIGNEAHMADYDVFVTPDMTTKLNAWKSRGESVALVAVLSESTQNTWQLACSFAISDPLRPEAIGVIRALKKRGIDVWMLSGDNSITANAVGAQVGIPASNIIAGVLPDEKAKKIEYLQQTLTKSRRPTPFRIRFPFGRRTEPKRATIAMVGDGINDAPALSTADLSIAIGSGSDIALSSSSFILINSQLTTILTLLDLSRVVFRRVYFNFGWAMVYNLVAMPIAAGVLYPITTGGKMDEHGMQSGGKHIRLDPAWASLAMALSSLSVVCSSLTLRSRLPLVGFKARKEEDIVRDEGFRGDVKYIV